MKFARSLLALALFPAFAATASAQTAASAPTRAQIKAETAAANKAGKTVPGEEMQRGQATKKKAPSGVDRAAVKDETKPAVKAGAIPKGEQSVVGQDKGPPKKP